MHLLEAVPERVPTTVVTPRVVLAPPGVTTVKTLRGNGVYLINVVGLYLNIKNQFSISYLYIRYCKERYIISFLSIFWI